MRMQYYWRCARSKGICEQQKKNSDAFWSHPQSLARHQRRKNEIIRRNNRERDRGRDVYRMQIENQKNSFLFFHHTIVCVCIVYAYVFIL